MPIKNVNIVVRLEGGGIKKALYDGEGNVVSGDVSVLEDEKWSPKGLGRPVPPEPPKQPSINQPFDMPVYVPAQPASVVDLQFGSAIPDDYDTDGLPDDLPE